MHMISEDTTTEAVFHYLSCVLSQPKSFIRADTVGPPPHPVEIVTELFGNCYHLMIKVGACLVSYRVWGILQKYQLILGTGYPAAMQRTCPSTGPS